MPETAAPAEPKLRRELGLVDLIFFITAAVVGTRWVPAAANAGPGAIALWILAAILFVVPLAFAVGRLSARNPGAGGLYLWTRNAFGPWHGFLCFWIYWMGIAFWFPSAAMAYASIATYAFGENAARLGNNQWFVVGAALIAVWIALGTNIIGMKVGKWTENAGGAATWLIAGLMVAIACLVWFKRGSATQMNLLPEWNWGTVNFWSQIAYAVSGLEVGAMMGAEIRDPERNMPRAAWVTAIFATTFYVSATLAVLVILAPSKVNIMNGLPQSGAVAGELLNAAWIPAVIAILMSVTACGQFGALGSATSRLPYAAGTDALLPAAFARVHPRWGTPHVSILALGGVATFFLLAIQLGDNMHAAYQALVSLMVIAGFIPYLYIFASAWKAGLRWSAASGLGVTVLALLCSVIPTAEVTNVWVFETKLVIGTAAVVGSAWLVYRTHATKTRR
jgi:amino acid transporter